MCYYCGCRPREISENDWKEIEDRLTKIESRLEALEDGTLKESMDNYVKEQMECAQLRLGIEDKPLRVVWDSDGYNQWGTKYISLTRCTDCDSDVPAGNMYSGESLICLKCKKALPNP